MKIYILLTISILFFSCSTLKIDIPRQNGIKGYYGKNADSIKHYAQENANKIKQFYLNDDLNWGLAMSGGGIRSAAFNIGALKALYDMNFLDTVEIISSVSGGSYASGWYFSNGVETNSKNIGYALLNEDVILKNICKLQNKSNSLRIPTMVSSIFLPPNAAFKKYQKGINRTFLSDSIGLSQISFLQKHIKAGNIPQLIINSTISSKPGNDWLSSVFEFTPFNKGNPEIGFSDDSSITLSEAITISGAALKLKLRRKICNDSSLIQNKFIPLTDGGHSENLGAISLIRRGVKNIIIVDAEHNKDYSFDGYKILKSSIKKELNLTICVPTIDSFIEGKTKELKTSVHIGQISQLYIDSNYSAEPLNIKIYYIKMSLPQTISTAFEDCQLYNYGEILNNTYETIACKYRCKKNKCKYYDKELVNITTTKSDFKALSIYWAKSYSNWLNYKSKWRFLNYKFPHITTADQSFYRDQMAAFIGLGYLQMSELKKHIINKNN
jgi:hypothetical protein